MLDLDEKRKIRQLVKTGKKFYNIDNRTMRTIQVTCCRFDKRVTNKTKFGEI
jgi:hypothetical protein